MTFNWFQYKELNPDLFINHIITENDCINHYNNFGKNENRKICIDDEYVNFNWKQYKNNYSDLSNIFTTKEEFENHWLQFGRYENRTYLHLLYKEYPNFNWEQYKNNYSDLSNIFTTKEEFENHWLQFGRYENRTYLHLLYKEYPNFNWEQYKNNYSDLSNIFTTKEEFENHWLQFGQYENRSYQTTRIKNITDWRIFCKDNLNYLNILDICTKSNSNINAVLIEFRILDNLEFVIRNTIIKLKTKCIYTVVCGNLNFDYITSINLRLKNILTIIKLNYDNINIDQYSSILTTLSFWDNLSGNYILIYQEDSCVFKDNIEEFLCFDYIGAPWSKLNNDNKNLVGNGGFSLRNKNIMMQIIQKINPLELTYCSSTLDYMKKNNINHPPEDVYFSKAMLDYNIGILADWNSAITFSTESIFNINSFGGHKFWLNGNALDLLYKHVVIKFKPSSKKEYEHRGGWNSVLSNLINNNFYSNDSNCYFFDIIEEYFLWKTDYVCKNKWGGFIHLTANTPKYLENTCNINTMFNNNNFIESLKYCFIIFTLSEYSKKQVLVNLNKLNINIKVIAVKHPINNALMFDINNYNTNNCKIIIQIGQQLRMMSSIYRFNIKNHTKMWLTGMTNITLAKQMLIDEIEHLKLDINISNVQITYIDNFDLYDILLSKNIVFIHLFDASANNTVIECIIRNTPLIVNRLEAVEEYLGKDYPLYFNNLDELNELITFSNIEKAYKYLVALDKSDLTFRYFNNNVFMNLY